MHSVVHVCPGWPVISIYTLLSLEYHSRLQFHTAYSSFYFTCTYLCDAQGSSVPAEVGQTSSGDSGGNPAAVDQVFSMFKDFLDKKIRRQRKAN